MPRRLPAPWTAEQATDSAFSVKDANGVALAYVYFDDGDLPLGEANRGPGAWRG